MNEVTKSTTSKTPDYYAYHVRDAKDGESYWTRIGSAWTHRDGKGINLTLNSVPLDGRISLRSSQEQE
ncbi:MAG TPA: hypothetical protein VGO27_23210 [Candidatus Acidoferrum sp.]|nr:hypothetical protein [Candidatus Acidoferrum sp.]